MSGGDLSRLTAGGVDGLDDTTVVLFIDLTTHGKYQTYKKQYTPENSHFEACRDDFPFQLGDC